MLYIYNPPSWLEKVTVVQSESVITLQKVETTVSTKKEVTQTTSLQIRPTKQDLKAYLREVSATYGVDYEVLKATIQCESGFDIQKWSFNHSSYGVAQFTPATWKDFGAGAFTNPYAQLETMARIWNTWELYKGVLRQRKERWDCYRLGLYKKYF